MTAPLLHGLVLGGGKSRRMKRDKGRLDYHGSSQLAWTARTLVGFCREVRVGLRPDQETPPDVSAKPLYDRRGSVGPLDAILSALEENPGVAWLVVACDLPLLNRKTLQALVAGRDPRRMATAFRSSWDGLPEPLCAIYEPSSLPVLADGLARDVCCPRKILIQLEIPLLELPDSRALHNINTPEEYDQVQEEMKNVSPEGEPS